MSGWKHCWRRLFWVVDVGLLRLRDDQGRGRLGGRGGPRAALSLLWTGLWVADPLKTSVFRVGVPHSDPLSAGPAARCPVCGADCLIEPHNGFVFSVVSRLPLDNNSDPIFHILGDRTAKLGLINNYKPGPSAQRKADGPPITTLSSGEEPQWAWMGLHPQKHESIVWGRLWVLCHMLNALAASCFFVVSHSSFPNTRSFVPSFPLSHLI